jgi:hypothetical protein
MADSRCLPLDIAHDLFDLGYFHRLDVGAGLATDNTPARTDRVLVFRNNLNQSHLLTAANHSPCKRVAIVLDEAGWASDSLRGYGVVAARAQPTRPKTRRNGLS